MRTRITWVLALTLVAAPSLSFANQTTGSDKLELRNVELTPAGSLEGQLLNSAGAPVANAEITVRSQADVKQVGQRLMTNEKGQFLATGLNNGMCVVEAGEATYAVRVWKKGSAPPESLSTVAFVQEDETVRGQSRWTHNRFANWVRSLTKTQKVALGVLIGAAIAIPIALDDDGS
ncbi:MAG: hypothetical protein Fues2KO_49470 [Fuerstiella sp.]